MGFYRFGEFELDLDAFALKRGAEVLPLQPKVLDVLRYLVEHRGRMVSKSELLRELWREEYVNEAVVTWSVSHIRRALGQQRGEKSPIETVHGRGYRFTGEVTAGASMTPPVSPAAPAHASSTLVGRERVMSELEQHVQDVVAGRGGLCLLTGEAGIGKTRCADELARTAGAAGVRVLSGRCPQDAATPPLWPVASALAQLGDEHAEIAGQARALLNAGDEQEDEHAEGRQLEEARFSVIETTARSLRDVARARPTLLVLDDLHWADAATLRVLGFIVPELRDIPLCVVGTLRESAREPGSAQHQLLLQLTRYAHRLPLGSLDAAQVADLVEVLSARRPTDALAEAVRRAADGVPLFVHEVVRSLTLEHGQDALAKLQPEAVSVPELARDLLRQRIHRLPQATIELLSRAAVIGDSFDLSLLAALVELEPEGLLDRLEPALAEGQLESEAPHRYRFVHSLFRSVLYGDLTTGQRVAIHRRIGTLLEARCDTQTAAGEIARHFYLSLPAGEHEGVMRRARKAGNAAMRVFAFDDAVRYYKWALEAQGFGGVAEPRTRADLLLSLASAQRWAGRTGEATQTATRLIELAQQHQMHDLVVRATRLRRPTVAMATVPDAFMRSALEAVLQHLPEGTDPTRISALSQLAHLPPYERDLSRSKELSTRAVALAEQQADRQVLLEALRARLFSLSGPDDVNEVLQVADRMLALQDAGQASWHSGEARGARFFAFLLAGRIADADLVLEEMTAAIPGPHWPEATFYCERLRAQRMFLDGRFDDAEQRWKTVHREAARAGVSYADMFRRAQWLQLTLERQGARAVVDRRFGSRADVQNLTLPVRLGMTRIAAQAGALDFVRTQLASLGDPGDYPREGTYLHMLASWSVCAAAVRDKSRCEQLLQLLSPYAGFNTPDVMGYYLGSVAHFLGLLSAALGRRVEARAYFERSLSHNRSMGYRAGVVRSLLAHADLERSANDKRRARELWTSARTLAQELGMQSVVTDANAALSTC